MRAGLIGWIAWLLLVLGLAWIGTADGQEPGTLGTFTSPCISGADRGDRGRPVGPQDNQIAGGTATNLSCRTR